MNPNGKYLIVESVNALSGLYIISTFLDGLVNCYRERCVNALSGLYLISTTDAFNEICNLVVVSMPSRAYTSFLLTMKFKTTHKLKEHASMPSWAYTSFLRKKPDVI